VDGGRWTVEENSKSQAPNSKQAPITNDPMTKTKRTKSSLLSLRFLPYTLFWTLEFGTWNLFGIWCLELAA
jgi:hypothetical protein